MTAGPGQGARLGPGWDSWVLTLRALRRWRRDPATLVESLVMPVALLFTLNIVLGEGISDITGESALYGSVPMIAMVAAMSGSMIGGVGLMRERDDGLLSRLWVLRIHRSAGLTARLMADAVRIVVTTVVILGVAVLLGFRFRHGFLPAVMWVFVPATFGLAFTMFVITVALFSARTLVVEATELVWGFLMFFSTGFVPLNQYPGWIQPFVDHQPVSCVVDTMRGLALGGPVLGPLAELLMWCAVVTALCAAPMILGYRSASMRN